MKGELFFKVRDGYVDKQGNPVEWVDAYDEWGVSLHDGGLSALMTFRPNKELVVNKNVTAQGAFYVTGGGLIDERTIDIAFHIVAIDKADFLLKRAWFINAIRGDQNGAMITMRIESPVEATYKFYYQSCSNYYQNLDGMAIFTLNVYETNGLNDGVPANIEPNPMHQDMEQYLLDLLTMYGGLASEQDVRDIIRNYRPINTNGNFA